MRSDRANSPDWSALIPVLPGEGPRRAALYAELRRLIETRQLAPGAKLPPTRALAQRLGVARGAVVAAFEQLVAEGFAEARVGAGTFVAAAVPRLAPEPVRPARPLHRHLEVLPGRLGSAAPDPRTLALFGRLLQRQLARPVASCFHYGDPQGEPALRAAIADYLRAARGVRLHADQIVVTHGAQHAIDLVARAALEPGEAVWFEDPGYGAAVACLRGAGLSLVPVPVDAEGLDPAAGIARAPRARAAYVTPSHQFPMGVVLSMRRRLALLAWAREAGAWIIEDDYDSEFRYAGPPLASLQGMDGGGRVVYVGTFSKALFPGLRVGYAVLPEPLLERVLALRERSDRYPSPLLQGALAVFLREGHFAAHLRRARARARAARDALVAGLAAGGLAARPPDQGLHLVVDLPVGLDEADAVSRAAGVGLAARALSGLHLAEPVRHGLVVGFSGFAPQALEEAARRFGEAARRPS